MQHIVRKNRFETGLGFHRIRVHLYGKPRVSRFPSRALFLRAPMRRESLVIPIPVPVPFLFRNATCHRAGCGEAGWRGAGWRGDNNGTLSWGCCEWLRDSLERFRFWCSQSAQFIFCFIACIYSINLFIFLSNLLIGWRLRALRIWRIRNFDG